MNNKTLIFMALSFLVVMTASFLQNVYYPAVPPSAAISSDNENADDASGVQQDADSPLETEEDSKPGPTIESPAAQIDDSSSDTDSLNAEPNEPRLEAADDLPLVVEDADQGKLYTIGSLSPDSGFRFLITLDAGGAAVRRVELNFRNQKGGFKYKDLEYKGGYLGELDCLSTPAGCKVRVVGHGTPAAIAGLQVGDVITSVDGEPTMATDDLAAMLGNKSPGQVIAVAAERDGTGGVVQLQVTLTAKPMEMIRPEPDVLEEGRFGRTSFRTTLRVPNQQVTWPEVDPEMMDAAWDVDEVTESNIKFSYTITSERLESLKSDVPGPLRITKTFGLDSFANEESEVDSKDFHFHFDFAVENLSGKNQSLCYQLDGPLGTPTETWWYQNKIHGRSSAIGYTAGARDVISSTGQEDFTFFGGPEIVGNIQKTNPKYFWLLEPPESGTEDVQTVKFLSVDTQYFNVALLPTNVTDAPFTAYSAIADVENVEIPKNKREQRLVDCTFRMFKKLDLEAGQTYTQQFEIFAGPKEPELLSQYGLDDVRSFGWFGAFSKPLCWLLQLFYKLTFQMGYGIPIILLTILVRGIMVPISRKAALNAQMMQYLQPQMKEIADKYQDDMEKRAQSQRALFKKYNYNPFGGCFMMFFQIPIFIGLYRGLSVDVALRDQPLFPGLSWCSNLSAPDQLWYWKDSLPQFMSFLTDETGWLGPYFNILPIITVFLFIAQQKLFTPPPTDEQQEMMQKVMKYMMVFMGVLFFKVPAGLCLYFITSSIWGIAERKMLPKPELDKSKLDDVLGDDSSSASSQKSSKKKAAELKLELDRQSNLDEKKRLDKERKKRLKQRGV